MIVKEFTLDFTGQSGVPSQWGINLFQVAAWFTKQTTDVPHLQSVIQVTGDFKRGVFNVVSLTAEAATYLSNFKLTAEKYGKRFEIPLREKRKRRQKVGGRKRKESTEVIWTSLFPLTHSFSHS